MARSRSTPTSTEHDPEFEAIADELYALPPADFAAARDEYVRKARSEGRQALARELGQVRRPTLSAWLINLLWRDQRDVMQQLFQLADALRQAQAQAAGAELRSLTTQRRELETALLRRATELAEERGVKVTDTVAREAQETLSAALVDPQVADEVRAGRLVKPASYAGFGVLPAARPVQPVPPRREEPTKPDDLQALLAQRARERREAAEHHVAEARAAVDAAAATLGDRDRDLQAARSRHRQLRDRMEQLQEQLRQLQRDTATAEQTEIAATRHREDADKAQAAARRELERAEAELQELAD